MVLPHTDHTPRGSCCVRVDGPIIIGAGPAGLAVAASLDKQGVPYVVLEQSDCIASLWQYRTYDRLKLNASKQLCQLPRRPFPEHFPEHPTRRQFIDYLEDYAAEIQIKPVFNTAVPSARHDTTSGIWRMHTSGPGGAAGEMEYTSKWLVVATGENAESVVPDIPGLDDFDGRVTHVSDYKCGEAYRGQRVLVVGCGNSGMEVCVDLCDYGAYPTMVVRDRDAIKSASAGDIDIVPAVKRFVKGGRVEFTNGRELCFDAVVLATGYRSNVPQWLQANDLFDKDGYPKKSYPNGWKGESGSTPLASPAALGSGVPPTTPCTWPTTSAANGERKPSNKTNPCQPSSC